MITRKGFLMFASASACALVGCTSKEITDDSADGAASTTDMEDVRDVSVEPVETDHVEEALSRLNLEQKVAQLFVVRPEDVLGTSALEVGAEDSKANSSGQLTVAGEQVKAAIEKIPVGGIAFFGGNLENPSQSEQLIDAMNGYITEACGIPPLLCVDEEGGTVARIANNQAFGVSNVGDMQDVGATDNPANAKTSAQTISAYLKPLGFNTDFAPVADIADNPDSQVMEQRSFGDDAEDVADMVKAAVEGFVSSDMICSLKHFPGLGSAVGDSHDSRIVVQDDIESLMASELVPFKAGIEAGAPMVMTGHLSVPNITGDNTPSSLSKTMVTDVLREQLGFDGVVITDSLGMGAVTDFYSTAESVIAAIEAGCDIALMPVSLSDAYQAVLQAAQNGILSEERIDQSVRRILRMKSDYIGLI